MAVDPQRNPKVPAAGRRRFGEIAVARGFVTEEQVRQALAAQQFLEQQDIRKLIGEILVETAHLTQQECEAVLSAQGRRRTFPRRTLGHFEIQALVGEGSFGQVVKARQTTLDRIVALKVLPPELSQDRQFLARFQEEARNMARLNHPNIVSCYDQGEDDGYP